MDDDTNKNNAESTSNNTSPVFVSTVEPESQSGTQFNSNLITSQHGIKRPGSKKVLFLVLGLVAILIVGGIISYLYLKPSQSDSKAADVKKVSVAGSESTNSLKSSDQFVLPAGYSWYTSSQYGFKIAYPTAWQADENPDIATPTSEPNYVSSGWQFQISFNPVVSSDEIQAVFLTQSDNYQFGTATTTTGAVIQKRLNELKNGTFNNGPSNAAVPKVLSYNAYSYVTFDGYALDIYKIVSAQKINVSSVSAEYRIYNPPDACPVLSIVADSSSLSSECVNQSDLNEITNIANSFQLTQ